MSFFCKLLHTGLSYLALLLLALPVGRGRHVNTLHAQTQATISNAE
jgi:hypothetical protein